MIFLLFECCIAGIPFVYHGPEVIPTVIDAFPTLNSAFYKLACGPSLRPCGPSLRPCGPSLSHCGQYLRGLRLQALKINILQTVS